MTTINGEQFLTIRVTAGEVYEIIYTEPPKLNILNDTEGEIRLGYSENFSFADSVGRFMSVPMGSAVNGLYFAKSKIYILTETDGNIVIERGSTAWHL